MNQNKIVGLVAVIALVVGVYAALVVSPPEPDSFTPQYLQTFPQPRELSDFKFVNQHNEPFTPEDLKQQWSLIFLGYTFCPDICPTTLASLNRIYPQLSAIDSKYPIKVVFVSVDPNRDTVERLKEYIGFFNPAFTAVTAEHVQLFPFARSLGLMYAISESTDNPNYLVDHSASIVLVNPQGVAVGRFKPKYNAGEIAISDSEQILADMPNIVNNL